jgi:hypothetical protein
MLHNMAASTDPTVNDDTGDGYEVGSHWFNTTADRAFVALDVSTGAAVWLQVTAPPTFHGCKAYNSATQTMNGSGTNGGWTAITFDSEEYDPDGYHEGVTNPSRITIPAGLGGYYRFGWVVYGNPPSAGTLVNIYIDGAASTKRGARVIGVVAGVNTTLNGTFEGNFTAGQYIEIQLNNPNASTFVIGHASSESVQTTLWCQLVGV